MDLVIFWHAPFVEFRFSRVPLYLTVLYSGVRRKFQFNGYNSIFLAYTNVCSVTSRGRGVLPYIGYTGMCHWKGCGFQAIYSRIGSSNHRKLV